MKRFYEAWKDDKRVQFYMVGVGESIARLKKFQLEHDAAMLPMLSDPFLVCGERYGVNTFPTAMIIDRDMTLRWIIKGKRPDIDEILDRRVRELL